MRIILTLSSLFTKNLESLSVIFSSLQHDTVKQYVSQAKFCPLYFALLVLSIASLSVPSWAESAPALSYVELEEPAADTAHTFATPLLEKLNVTPEDSNSRRAIISVYRRFGEYQKALEHAKQLALTEPNDRLVLAAQVDELRFQLENASMFKRLSIAKRLLTTCEEALKQDPYNTAALQCIASYHAQIPGGSKTKEDAAIAALESIDRPTFLMEKANQALRRDNNSEGLTFLNEALPLIRNANDAVNIAMIKLRLNDIDGAFAALDIAAGLDPDLPFLLYQTGRTSAVSGQQLARGKDAMLRFLSGSAWMGGTNFRAAGHWRLGMIFQHMGDKTLAEQAYRRALALDPNNKDAQASLKKLGV